MPVSIMSNPIWLLFIYEPNYLISPPSNKKLFANGKFPHPNRTQQKKKKIMTNDSNDNKQYKNMRE